VLSSQTALLCHILWGTSPFQILQLNQPGRDTRDSQTQ